MKRPIEMVFLKEEEEDGDLVHLFGCNPAMKKMSLPTKKQPRYNKDGSLRPALPLHRPPQTMTPLDWLLLAVEIARQELENEKKKKKKKSEIAVEIHPNATEESNEKKGKRRATSVSHPHSLNNKRRKVTHNTASCSVAVELPPEFRRKVREMGGKEEEAVLVIQKKLFKSDVEPNNSRFSIPSKQVANEFLTPQEKRSLHPTGSKIKNILFIEPNCTSVCPITLAKWDMSGNCIYNLISNWKPVQERNGLVEGDLVQLWAFRSHPSQDLCLAMVLLPTH